ncbi:MAG: hypothetical protein ACI9X4_002911 [Glaciecola sp.]|jgi:hypothetical protein
MQSIQVPDHLRGLQGYAEAQHEIDPNPDLEEIMSYIGNITQVYGLVTDRDFDFESPTWALLEKIAESIVGVIFVCDSLVDTSGGVIFGPLDTPD